MSSLARPEPNNEFLVHDHHGLGGFAGLVVDGREISQRGFRDDAEAGAKAEGVFQAAGDDSVGNADIDHVRQLIARRRLGGSEADVAGIAADDTCDASGIHLLDLGGATVGRGLCVAKYGVNLAQSLDAAGSIDLLDCYGCAESTLLAGVRQRAGDRMQHTELH